MFKKRRIIGLLLVLALIAVLALAACGDDDEDEEKATATPTAAATEEATEAAATEEATEAPVAEETEAAATEEATEAPVVEETEAAATEEAAEIAIATEEATEEPVAEATEEPVEIVAKALIDCEANDLSELQIGLVTDVGEIDDKSFNQSSWEGVLAAELCGASVNYIETQDAADYADNIAEFAENGYDVIVTVGYALGPATLEAAATYPDVTFIGVDQFQGEPVANVVGLVFNEDQSGYLAGVLAANLTETGTIAAVLGTDQVPPVVAFKEGYEAGARFVNPDITIISTYHPGAIDQAFTDPEWGAATAKQALDQNADVVFAAGGKTGNGGLIEVANAVGSDGPPPFCIGVDTDQWGTVPEAHPCLVSSAMKLLDVGVADIIVAISEGTVEPGNFFGQAALADFHDLADVVPDEVKTQLEEIAVGLADGSISTGYGVTAEEPTATEEPEMEATEEPVAEATEEPVEIEAKALIDCEANDLSELQIGLVTDVGEIDDKSFNQSSWEGVLAAELCGASVNYIETQDAADYADNIAEFAENGYDVIVTVGYALGPATLEAAATYPDVTFIGVDQFQGEVVANVVGLVFNEDQSGYLAGVLAANLTETGTIAAVLGTDQVPPVVAFKEGYEAGARFVNPDITIISTYHPGAIDQAFTDPEWGAATAKQALDQNADVVFAAGGKTGNGGLIEVANAVGSDGPPPFCIGVDTDQWGTVPEAHPCLVSSAMKLLDVGVADIIVAISEGTVEPGNFFGQAALADFHDLADVVPDEVKTQLEEIAVGLADGSISTGYGVTAEEPTATEEPEMEATEEPVAEATEEPVEIEAKALIDCEANDLSELQIGLVTDVGEIDDKSFNQSSWEGVLAAELCGASVNYIETQDAADYADNIAEFAENGYDVIVTVGYALGPATLEAAATYPDVTFIGVDQFQGEPVANVVGLVFNEDQSGYLAGVLAANLTETGTIAAVLGTDQVPPVVAFKEGYEAGARFVNPDITIISTYHPGAIDQAFTDPEWGAATAKQALDQNADVVFAAGGKTGNGGLIEVANAVGSDGPPPFCIGVDTDQWGTVPEAHPCLVSSAMKLLDVGVADIIVAISEGTVEPGNFFGQAALADFHDLADVVPDEVKTQLEEIAAGLVDGSISTGYGVEAEPANLIDVVTADGRFSMLLSVVEMAGLSDVLAGEGPFTVFAPNDEALTTVLTEQADLASNLMADTEILGTILKYHVVEGELKAADLEGMETITTLQGEDIAITVGDDGTILLNGMVPVVEADIAAPNGVIHVINGFLVPPTVAAAMAPAEAPATEEAETIGAQGDLGVVKVGMNAEYQPFEFVDENGDIAGFDVDLITAIAEKAGFEIELVNTRWDGIFVALQSGEFDAVCSAATITEEREEIIDFSNPYFNAGQMIAVREADAKTISTPEDLAGLRVGVQSGTTGDIAASEIPGVEVVRYDEITLAFQALASGDVDAIVNDGPVSADIIAKNPELGAVLVGDPFTDEFYGIAVQPDKPELLDAINAALEAIIADGTYNEIHMKWFGVEAPSMFQPADE